MDLAVCPLDGAMLTVVERRWGPAGTPLMTCSECGRRFVLGPQGPEPIDG